MNGEMLSVSYKSAYNNQVPFNNKVDYCVGTGRMGLALQKEYYDQLKYVQDIMAKATGTFGFYNESLASVEAGDCFDNAMVDIFLGNQTPEEAFQTVQTFYEENVWE